ncbi:hypothetical protein ACFYPZ_39175 [Streptomyces sp. NPDC005506]|uniref:hypothetical protein n=1 Tax=unclassified Streptomyces TaxID=2593676 RepID=UPI003682C707
MTHAQEPEVVAVWHESSQSAATTRSCSLAGTVHAWTEPTFGETYYPGEDDPDCNPIRDCSAAPRTFCMSCANCGPCTCPPWDLLTFGNPRDPQTARQQA